MDLSERDIMARVEAADNKITYKNMPEGYKDKAPYPYSMYVGQMKDGRKNGYGTYISYLEGGFGHEKAMKYIGHYKDDKFHGHGIAYCTTRSKWGAIFDVHTEYVGQWKNGKRHGNGKKTSRDGTTIHSGEWINNKPGKNNDEDCSLM